jgi:cation diffusion facilitator CzcD-associated flavoprotein CzcO
MTGTGSSRRSQGLSVAIVGAGFGGIAAAAALWRAGHSDLTIFEASPGVGGTWFDNVYPGAATDAASHLYSYSYAPHDWGRTHVGHQQIRRYLEDVVDRLDLRRHLRLSTRVSEVTWDEARQGYVVSTSDGASRFFNAVVSAVGLFAKPRWPDWPGLDRFEGPVVHTARWKPVPLAGKRIAVVGTGSSAAQVVPALAPEVAHLTLFQRQPGWLLPKQDRDFSAWERALLRVWPLRKLYRLKLYLAQERREWNGAFFKPGSRSNTAARDAALAYIRDVFADRPDLAAAVTPDYPFAGKRAVVSSDFFPALKRPNVTLVPRAVASCTPGGLVDAAGVEHAADAIVLCTGFEATQYLSSLPVHGRNGKWLADVWAGEPQAFLGLMVPGFPNFFMLYGPNTNGGFIISNLERQSAFVAAEVSRLDRLGLPRVEVSQEATDRYNSWLQTRMAGTAFAEGQNYFKSSTGRIVTQWPDNATQYAWRLTSLRRFSNWREPVPAGATQPAQPEARDATVEERA